MKRSIFFIIGLIILLGLWWNTGRKIEVVEDAMSEIEYTEPPELSVMSEKGVISAVGGNYTWRIIEEDGSVSEIMTDAEGNPVKMVEKSNVLVVESDKEAVLEWLYEPIEYKVFLLEENKTIEVNTGRGIFFPPLEEGEYIYEVYAKWDEGTCHYAFKIQVIKE